MATIDEDSNNSCYVFVICFPAKTGYSVAFETVLKLFERGNVPSVVYGFIVQDIICVKVFQHPEKELLINLHGSEYSRKLSAEKFTDSNNLIVTKTNISTDYYEITTEEK